MVEMPNRMLLTQSVKGWPGCFPVTATGRHMAKGSKMAAKRSHAAPGSGETRCDRARRCFGSTMVVFPRDLRQLCLTHRRIRATKLHRLSLIIARTGLRNITLTVARNSRARGKSTSFGE